MVSVALELYVGNVLGETESATSFGSVAIGAPVIEEAAKGLVPGADDVRPAPETNSTR